MAGDKDFERRLELIERSVREIEAAADAGVARHRAAARAGDSGAARRRPRAAARDRRTARATAGQDIIDRLGRDELVSKLLLLHSLHPVGARSAGDAGARRRAAVAAVAARRRGARSASTTGGVRGAGQWRRGDGVPPSIERAILEAAPDVTALEVEGRPTEAAVVGFVSHRSFAVGAAAGGDAVGRPAATDGVGACERRDDPVRPRRCVQRAAPVRAQAGRRASSASCAAARWRRAPASASSRRRGSCCVCATPARFSFRAATPSTSGCRDAIRVLARFPAHRRAVGQPADSDRDGVLLSRAARPDGSWPSIRVPAGPTESLLPLETWDEIVAENPVLATLEPDVEALLVNRLGVGRASGLQRASPDYYILPIDECLPARRPDPPALEGAVGRDGGVERDRRLLRRAAGRRRARPREVARA